MTRPALWQDRAYPVLLVALSLAAYLAFACPYVLGGDNAEFVALAARGGVAHPPGYPLLTLVLHALSGLLASSPALGAARATAVTGALAAGALYAACRSFRASPAAALLASTAYASSPLAWLYATQAEVWALNALLCATLAALAGPACFLRGTRRLAGIALVMGLGLSHHPTILALGPIALVGAVRAARECPPADRWRAVPVALGALALGICPYAYLAWASRHAEGCWVWGDSMSLRDLLRHVERVEYWEQRALDHRVPVPSMHWAALAQSLERGLLWAGVPLAAIGLGTPLVRGLRPSDARGPGRWDATALAASVALAGPVLLALLVGKPLGVYAVIIERLHLLPQLLLSIPLAWGIDAVLRYVRPSVATPIMVAAVGLASAFAVLDVPAELRETERPTVEQYLRNTLGQLPPGAVVVGTGDHRCFGFFFLQTVLGVRPDVVYVEAGMLRASWYRARLVRALGEESLGVDARALVGALADEGRHVFVTDSLDQLLPPGHPTYAMGMWSACCLPGQPYRTRRRSRPTTSQLRARSCASRPHRRTRGAGPARSTPPTLVRGSTSTARSRRSECPTAREPTSTGLHGVGVWPVLEARRPSRPTDPAAPTFP